MRSSNRKRGHRSGFQPLIYLKQSRNKPTAADSAAPCRAHKVLMSVVEDDGDTMQSRIGIRSSSAQDELIAGQFSSTLCDVRDVIEAAPSTSLPVEKVVSTYCLCHFINTRVFLSMLPR